MVIRVGVGGIGGRMGREIVAAASGETEIRIVGGVERPDLIPALERENGPERRIAARLDELLPDIDVLVDFTTPATTVAHARSCAEVGRPFVSGVTGLTDEHLSALREAGRSAPVFYARNMSVGINALIAALPALIRALDDYDVEIVEAHHRHKVDAPSGTALALAEAIVNARGVALEATVTYGRRGVAPRRSGEIGIHAVRGGGNAGEHGIIISDDGEEITIGHRAYSRRTFANGALRAARFVVGRPPGYYSMTDLVAFAR